MGEWMNGFMEKLTDVRRENLEAGGAEHIELQHELGKLTARERIELLVDAGSIVMDAVKGMGVDLAYAWPIAQYAVEASTQDYRQTISAGLEADAYSGYLNRSREKIDVFEAARSWTAHMVDEVIDPADTRIKIIEALELTCNKQEKLPKRAKVVHNTAPT